jgi:hypothetical protein
MSLSPLLSSRYRLNLQAVREHLLARAVGWVGGRGGDWSEKEWLVRRSRWGRGVWRAVTPMRYEIQDRIKSRAACARNRQPGIRLAEAAQAACSARARQPARHAQDRAGIGGTRAGGLGRGGGGGVEPAPVARGHPFGGVDDELPPRRVGRVQADPDPREVVGGGDEAVVGRRGRAEVAQELPGRARRVPAGVLEVAAGRRRPRELAAGTRAQARARRAAAGGRRPLQRGACSSARQARCAGAPVLDL